MTRIVVVPVPIRAGAVFLGVAGALALAGCAPTAPGSDAGEQSGAAAPDGASAHRYLDGTYTQQGSYQVPGSVETISVTVTIKDDEVTAVKVVGHPTLAEVRQYQSQFIGGIAAVVVGKDIDDLAVSRVAGSSLTGAGFNRAIDRIKSAAKP